MGPYKPDADNLQKNAIEVMTKILNYRSSTLTVSENFASIQGFMGVTVSIINFVKYAAQLTSQTASRFQVRITNQTNSSFYIYRSQMKNVSRPKYEIAPGDTTLVDVSNLMPFQFKSGGRLSFAYIKEEKVKEFTVYFNYYEPDTLPFLGAEAILADKEYINPYCKEPHPPESSHPFIGFWAETINNDFLIYANHIYSNTAIAKITTVVTLELILC